MQMYFGDVSLCYTYSLAMALHSYGYDVRPEFLEAIMVMGNGASIIKEDAKHPLVFFDNGMPDSSISHSLNILGFTYDEYYIKDSNTVNLLSIREMLSKFLLSGPVVLGPLDMGYLTYNPNHIHLYGVDHFVSVYDLDDEFIYLHDPAGFACMKMCFSEFSKAWEAKNIDYKRGSFSMWGNFKKIKSPTSKEIYQKTSVLMKQRYEHGEENVIARYAKSVADNGLNEEQKHLHQYFSFKLASIRNLYMSNFLKDHDTVRSELKENLARLFGQAHLFCIKEDYQKLSEVLFDIAALDNKFRDLCVHYKVE